MKADMMKNTHGLNRWVVFDDILRFADYIPVVLSHTIHSSSIPPSEDGWHGGGKNISHHGSIHIRNIHAWLSLWHHQDISPHISFLPCSSSYTFPSPPITPKDFLSLSATVLAEDDKSIFFFTSLFPLLLIFSLCLRHFPSFDLNILDKQRRKNNFLYPHYLCTDTHASVCLWYVS